MFDNVHQSDKIQCTVNIYRRIIIFKLSSDIDRYESPREGVRKSLFIVGGTLG